MHAKPDLRVFLKWMIARSGLGDRGRYLLMKLLLPILILFLIAGCVEQSKIVPMETNQSAISRADTYSVLGNRGDRY